MKRAWIIGALLVIPHLANADESSEANDVLVHVDGSPRASLQRLEGSGWVEQCMAPCDLRVLPRNRYRVGGKGIHESAPFSLTAAPGSDETIHVHGGTESQSLTGEIIFLTGLVGSVGGLLITGVAIGANTCDSIHNGYEGDQPCNPYDALRYTGISIGIGGLVNILAGALIYSASSKSTVVQSPGVTNSARLQLLPLRPLALRGDRFEHRLSPLAPPPVSPLFSLSF